MAGIQERGRSRRADELKARLLGGYVSSGSEHDAGDLSGVVDGIFFSDEEDAGEMGNDVTEEFVKNRREGSPSAPVAAMVRDLVRPSATDPFAVELAADAAAVAERLAGLRPSRAAFCRAVMSSLRESGYNAGVCKLRWESRGGVTGGIYEYIDVVRQEAHRKQNPHRYLVDVDFKAEFEIARPTAEYERVVAQLPRVYVGRPEDLKRLLRLLADAAKRSLQSREMHVPPWRKSQYLQAKWLGAYRRTTNAVPVGSAALPPSKPGFDVKCRPPGFFLAAPPGIPPAARMR